MTARHVASGSPFRGMSSSKIYKQVRSEVAAGRDRHAVFAAYAPHVTRPSRLATVIASVPRPELRRRVRHANWTLAGLLAIAAVAKVVFLAQTFAEYPPVAVAVAALGVLVPLAFLVEVVRMNGRVYWLLLFLCGLGLVRILTDAGGVVAADLQEGLLMAMAMLSLFIRWAVFPNLGFTGARRDAAGQYLL